MSAVSYVSLFIVHAADAVFESVAQVLLSRSRGLTSRFQQLVSKSDAEVVKCCEQPLLSFSLSLSSSGGDVLSLFPVTVGWS